MNHVFFLFVGVVWGSSFIFMDRAGWAFGPITIGAIGTLGGAVILGTTWFFRRTPCPSLWLRTPALLVMVIAGYSWPFAIQPYLIEHVGHGYIAAFVCIVPILTILISIPMLGEIPSPTQVAGVLVGFVFLSIYLRDGIERDVTVTMLVLAASVPTGYAISNCTLKRWFSDVPSVPLACVGLTISGLMLLPAALVFESIEDTPNLREAIFGLSMLALLSRGISVGFFYTLIRKRGPLFASMVTYMIPIIALGWSWLDHERITIKQLLAVAGALAMVAVVQWDIERRVGKQHATG